jgi:hypothetical protein
MIDRLRSGLDPLRKNDPPRAWWDVLLWMPVGFAIARVAGDSLPPPALAVLMVLLAAAHHFGPAVIDVMAGGGGLLLSLLAVWDGDGCQDRVGDMGIVVLVVFGSIFVVSSWVRLIGSASLREMGRHLLIATVSIEIALFAASPGGGDPLIDPDNVAAPIFLSVVLLIVCQVALIDRMELGMLCLGATLVPVEAAVSTHANPCGPGGYNPLVGMVAFAGAAYYFALSRPIAPDGDDEPAAPVDPRRGHAPEGTLGAWVDATPESGVWVDTSQRGVWVDDTPETGVWHDDDYEYEFKDPEAGIPREADLTYANDDPALLDDAPGDDGDEGEGDEAGEDEGEPVDDDR